MDVFEDPREYDIDALIEQVWGRKSDREPPALERLDLTEREKENRALSAALLAYLRRCKFEGVLPTEGPDPAAENPASGDVHHMR